MIYLFLINNYRPGPSIISSHAYVTVDRLLHAEKIETKIAKGYYSDASDSSESHDSSSICFPKDPNAKPSDEPEMHCYTLGR